MIRRLTSVSVLALVEICLGAEPENPEVDDSMFYIKAFLLPLLILFCFVGFAVVCDDYLAPSLEELTQAWNIPHDVACATFLAFGSSAPEICINCAATAHGNIDMSLGAVLGSGIIAYTIIPAASIYVSPGQVLQLEMIPLLRDVGFFCVALGVFTYFNKDGSFNVFQNVVLLSLYAFYLIVMYLLGKLYHNVEEEEEEKEDVKLKAERQNHSHTLHHFNSTSDAEDLRKKGNYGSFPRELLAQHEVEEAESLMKSLISCIEAPIRFVLRSTIPPLCYNKDEDIDVSEVWPYTMFVSLVYVGLLSEAVFLLTTAFAETVQMPHHLAGLTILALGAQVSSVCSLWFCI